MAWTKLCFFCLFAHTFICGFSVIINYRTKIRSSDTLSELGYQKLEEIMSNHPAPYGYRDGNATSTHSCERIRDVPTSLRYSWVMKPGGIKTFYTKYTEAYGIPVVSSKYVRDNALRRACYILRFSLAEHSGMRQLYYKLYGRVAVIGEHENVTDIPEYSFLPDSWNDRSRGFGATESVPVSSGAEENLLCFSAERDRYHIEDIFLHEFTHGIHLLGAKYAIPGFQTDLENYYNATKNAGLWKDTYSMSTMEEYLAEGVQSYYSSNGYSATPNGVHGPINSPELLQEYDPDLYRLIQLMFPCGNTLIKRCQATRATEASQQLHMDCDLTEEYQAKLPETTPDPCTDKNANCADWARIGECEKNPSYMEVNCQKSCNLCGTPQQPDTTPSASLCEDQNIYCPDWAALGECSANPAYMHDKCRKSCGTC